MATFARIGYGQVEPNQLSGIKTGQIFASLPLDKDVLVLENGQFMFYNYGQGKVTADDATEEGGSDKMTEAYLVYNEIKIYEDWLSYKDFAMIRVGDNYVTNRPAIGTLTSQNAYLDTTTGENAVRDPYQDGSRTVGVNASPAHTEYGYRMDGIAPRLVKTNIGDIWTTNTLVDAADDSVYDVGKVIGLQKVTKTVDSKTFEVLELSSAPDTATTMKFVITKKYTMPDGQRGFKVQRIA